MSEKVYSHLSEIPSGHASNDLIEGCLVLEGGAFRGLYTQGFLDAMMLCGLNFSCVIGVSAGALSGVNYVSGQIGRLARINLGFRHDSRYVGAKAVAHSFSIIDVGFLTEDRHILEPFDQGRFDSPDQRFVAVVTNCLTGETEYHEKGKCEDIMRAVRASATMPYISPMVDIGGIPYLDGGCSCKIPYEWALDQGYSKIVVVKTRELGFRKRVPPTSPAHAACTAIIRRLRRSLQAAMRRTTTSATKSSACMQRADCFAALLRSRLPSRALSPTSRSWAICIGSVATTSSRARMNCAHI